MSVIAVNLSDLMELPLRNIAAELAIPEAETLNKSELIAAIREKLSPNSPVVLSPFKQPEPPKWWKTPTTIIALAALVVTITGAVFTGFTTYYFVQKFEHELLRDTEETIEAKRTPWKALKVYDIIDRTTLASEKWQGVDFEEIRLKYSQEVQAEQNVVLGKSDLQPDELRSILKDLVQSGLVAKTVDNKFTIMRHVVQSRDCQVRPATEAIQQAMIRILSTESGKYTIEKLVMKIVNEFHFKADDVYAAANCMKAGGAIYLDDKNMVWTILETPPPKIAPPKPMEPAPPPKPLDFKKVCCGGQVE